VYAQKSAEIDKRPCNSYLWIYGETNIMPHGHNIIGCIKFWIHTHRHHHHH